MNLLELIREHAGRQGLPAPVTIAGSNNPHAIQAMGLLNDFVDDLTTRKFWERNVRTASWNILPDPFQGEISQLAPAAFEGIMPDTFFCSDHSVPLRSVTPSEWAQMTNRNIYSTPFVYYQEDGKLYLNYPSPTVGGKATFKYYSGAFVQSPADGAYKRYFNTDTDVCILGDSLPLAYLRWRWRREKGFDYAEEFVAYERLLQTKSSRDGGAKAASLNPEQGQGVRPGIFVPEFGRTY